MQCEECNVKQSPPTRRLISSGFGGTKPFQNAINKTEIKHNVGQNRRSHEIKSQLNQLIVNKVYNPGSAIELAFGGKKPQEP